ncbi:MAG TPA: DUF1572 family protein [Pirellulales bacterium]|nr:DUF1572 family protein [Pirellulales bacterium]
MPIESRDRLPGRDADVSIGRAFVNEARHTLADSMKKVEHCLDQLRDEDLWWRQHESQNSIQNILLHLCGNVRQWIIHGVGGAPDVRDRAQEFSDRRPLTKAELLSRLRQTLTEAHCALAELPPDRLLEPRRIQGFDATALAAIFETVSHFVGHTHQIVYIARLRLGDAYRFQWQPANEEEGNNRVNQ